MTAGGFGIIPALSAAVFPNVRGRAAIGKVRGAGYTAIGLPAYRGDFDVAELGPSAVRDLRALLDREGLAVSWLSAGPKGRLTLSQSVSEDVERVSAMLHVAGRLRAPAVAARVGPLGDKESQAAETARGAIAALCVQADAAGSSVALMPAAGERGLLDELLADFTDAPAGLLVDPGMMLFSGEDPSATAGIRGNIASVRASDSSGESVDLAPGEGRVAWRDFLAALGARDYYGYATVEFVPGGNAESRAAGALSTLRSI